jgi:TolB-like protein
MSDRNFFAELQRRNVYKVAVAYVVVSWLTIQAASILLPTFEAPTWVMKVVVTFLILGFPVALIFCWAFEITPEGIKRESEIELDKSIAHHTGRKIVALTVVLGLMAGGLLVFQLLRSHANAPAVTPRQSEAAITIPEKSIAVLPFDSLSEDKSNAYFAEGIQDEILTKLATIADLKVISRTSTARYASKPEDLKTVSQQLAVANVLEGSVQRAGERVRVNVQLIDARADSHLWAKSYDGDAKDIFAVETEVSQQVADALQAKLSPVETKTIASAPTKDAAAYDLFLKAESEFRSAQISWRPESFQQAVEWYNQAITRDPAFALAIARLAECQLNVHWYLDPLDDAHLAAIRTTIDHAVDKAPNLAETHVALGLFHYFGYRAYPEAAAEFRRAIKLQPNNSTALQYLGYVHRRQGQWQRALEELNKSLEQDPRDTLLTGNIANTYNFLRNYQEAIRFAKRALGVDPHEVVGMLA